MKNLAVLLAFAVLGGFAADEFLALHEDDRIYLGNPALTAVKKLSDWHPALLGTPGDTEVYVLDSGVPGGKALIYGGTHPNETAAVMNAVTYVENAAPKQGVLYVICQANRSAFTATLPLRGQMARMTFALKGGGTRTMRMGSRLTNPVHQWPDPNYRLNTSGRTLEHGEIAEIRNLNRNHPGVENGYLTEKVCHAIRTLIDREGIDLIYDGHEASCEFLRVNYLIAHERAMDLGATAILNATLDAMAEGPETGYPFKLDRSGASSWGLSHRALGDSTAAYATLFESLNPVMGFCHDKVTEALVKGGQSANYVNITNLGLLSSGELTEQGSPIEQRTAYHMEISRHLLAALGELAPEKAIVVEGLPSYHDMVENGLEATLKPLEP